MTVVLFLGTALLVSPLELCLASRVAGATVSAAESRRSVSLPSSLMAYNVLVLRLPHSVLPLALQEGALSSPLGE